MKDAIYTHLGDTITMMCDTVSHVANHHAATCSYLKDVFGDLTEDCKLLTIAAVLVAIIGSMIASRKVIKFVSKRLLMIALAIWTGGLFLYMEGFRYGGCEENLLALFLRSALSSLEMFASHSDLIEVNEELHLDSNYMLCFSIVHFLAVLTTSVFILNLFGLRIRNWWRIFCCNWQGNGKSKTYIFWGINEESFVLAADVKDKGKVVFVVDKQEKQSNGHSRHHFSFGSLLGLSRSNENDMEKIIMDLDGIVLKKKSADTFKPISRILRGEVHVLFLSNNEDENLVNWNRAKDDVYLKTGKVTFHCHAQKNLVNERIAASTGMKLIDSSYLSVLELKQKQEAHPVNFTEREADGSGRKTGVVTSAFNGLILGFGDTGQEALSFLYEFSAFVSKDGERSPYHLVVMDRDMDCLKGDFLAQRPALQSNNCLEFVSADVNTSLYWKKIDELIGNGLNYVVVALGNDRLNLSVGIQLQEYMMRYVKPNNPKYCIYIRQRGGMDETVKGLYPNDTLRTFGADKDVFSGQIIFNETYQKEAQRYADRYNQIGTRYNDCDDTVKKEDSDKSPLEKIRNEHRKYSQNLSNAYHKNTKIILLGEERITELHNYIRTPQDVKEFKGHYDYKHKETGETNNEVTALMINLAKCEHLRWNAAIEMLGYTQNKDDRSACNLTTMQHNCLTSWEDLLEIWKEFKGKKQYCEYWQYDYNVVETSIDLYLSETATDKES